MYAVQCTAYLFEYDPYWMLWYATIVSEWPFLKSMEKTSFLIFWTKRKEVVKRRYWSFDVIQGYAIRFKCIHNFRAPSEWCFYRYCLCPTGIFFLSLSLSKLNPFYFLIRKQQVIFIVDWNCCNHSKNASKSNAWFGCLSVKIMH